ncbi:predicted protein [Lichtheimia corymbifera JMRC:FSU:9682]|uniref:BHLH domain-containing protein n=1 Tax=Lichtheimia corymbifera JMRC:FSU:9682 TaxID=1263082 RepID=A0A068RTZ2_9FUNG|nr:predicted protein [Lichtheimia corymbifera JMRC:FSU:9682]
MDKTIIIPHDASSLQPDYLQCDAIHIPYTEEYHENSKKRRSSSLLSSYLRESSISSSSDDDDGISFPTSTSKRIKKIMNEVEKRANHTASEQKRRNAIRAALNDMTQIVPGLQEANINKSTILFKAAEYIHHLNRRNRRLRERIAELHHKAGYPSPYPSINVPADQEI